MKFARRIRTSSALCVAGTFVGSVVVAGTTQLPTEIEKESSAHVLPAVVVITGKYVVGPIVVSLAGNAIYTALTPGENVCEAEIHVHVNSDVGDENAHCGARGCTARTDLEYEEDPDNPWQNRSWAEGRAITKEISEPTSLKPEFRMEDLRAGMLGGHSFKFVSDHNWRGTTAKGEISLRTAETETVGARIDEISLFFADSTGMTTDTCDLFDGETRIRVNSNLRAVRRGDGAVLFDEDLLGCEVVLGPPSECGVGAPPTVLSNPCNLSFSFFPEGAGFRLLFHPYDIEPLPLNGWASGDTLDFISEGNDLEISFDRVGDPLIQGACCLNSGTCVILFREECPPAVGNYLGEDVPCDPYPCATPTIEKSWGEVKSLFR